MGNNFVPLLHMGKVRLEELKSFAQSHITNDDQSQNFKLDLINSQILQ